MTESSRVRIPEGRHFCLYALSAVIPLLPAKQRKLPGEDWLEQDDVEPAALGKPGQLPGCQGISGEG